jgi:D-2-hydroxyacid dehydrogenase (NADP+)
MKNILVVLTLPEAVREHYARELRAAFPNMRFDVVDHASKAGPYLDTADAVIAFGVMLTDEIFAKARKLKWVQAMGSGVDGIVDQPNYRDSIAVTNMQGLHGAPCAESALSSMLAMARFLPRVIRNQSDARWDRFPMRLLDGKTAVILGMGVIAEALAPRLKAMNMRTIGVTGAPRAVPGFDDVRPRSEMLGAVREADHLILLTPYTKENHHLVNAQMIAAMKPSSFLINLARGGVVDEDALVEALQVKRISGAALDVFAVEPLPADHILWTLDNVLITPHLAGFHDEYPQRALPILKHNVQKFLDGDIAGMINIVKPGA